MAPHWPSAMPCRLARRRWLAKTASTNTRPSAVSTSALKAASLRSSYGSDSTY
jgi:hypothetical protein